MRYLFLPVLLVFAACSLQPAPVVQDKPAAPEPTGKDTMAYKWGGVLPEGTANDTDRSAKIVRRVLAELKVTNL